jgi:hypothetical protein
MRIFIAAVFIFYSSICLAQPGGGKGGGLPTYTAAEGELLAMNALGPVPPPPGNEVPISGIEILIGLGAAFGAKRMISYHRKTKKDN